MSFEQKLNIVINEISNTYGLSQEQAILIRNNIISRVNMYSKVSPSFDKETKIIKDSNSIGDFFINRLVNNIRTYEFDSTYNRSNTIKGTYTTKYQSLYIGNYRFISDITYDKLKNRLGKVDSSVVRKATINVFNHEIGHALQTSFSGRNGHNDKLYNKLVSSLSNKYPGLFSFDKGSEVLTPTHEGMKVIRKNDKYKDARDFYAKNAYTELLDEIFNEDEALKITGVNEPQFMYDMGNGNYKNIYNYQSSNYKITSYGRMMKIIMGSELSFKSMYEDSIYTYKFFDQFTNLSSKVFGSKISMYNILNSLEKIKNSSSLEDSQKLDYFLTSCLKQKVSYDLSSGEVDIDRINEIRSYIEEFSNQMVRNPKIISSSDKIIMDINEVLDEKSKQLGINDGISML